MLVRMRARRSWNGMEIAARAGCGRIVCPDTDSDGLRVNEFARDAFFTMQLHKRGSSCSQRKNKICWRNSQHVRKRLDKVGGLGGWVIRMGWSHAKRISCRIASLDIPQKGWLWKISAIWNFKQQTQDDSCSILLLSQWKYSTIHRQNREWLVVLAAKSVTWQIFDYYFGVKLAKGSKASKFSLLPFLCLFHG